MKYQLQWEKETNVPIENKVKQKKLGFPFFHLIKKKK